MARLQQEKQAAVTTGSARSAGIPCAMVLRLIRDLLGEPGLFATVIGVMRNIIANLTPASGRQDHTISPSAIRHSSRDISRPSHPAPNVRDDREAPLL